MNTSRIINIIPTFIPSGIASIPFTSLIRIFINHILTFSHSHILTFSHSHILTFSHSHILTFSHSHILTFSHSHILTFSHSHILTFSKLRRAHRKIFISQIENLRRFLNSYFSQLYLICAQSTLRRVGIRNNTHLYCP